MREKILGFTATEAIGVLAVIAIIAAVLYPVVIRRIDIAAKERERGDLVAISNALVLHILGTKTIPHEATWTNYIANWAQLDTRKIALTPRRIQRRFMLDAAGWLNGIPATGFVQANLGATNPLNSRIIVMSSIRADPPNLGSRPSASDFQKIWDNPVDGVPAITAAWPRGEDLIIQRISLDQIFHKLVLVNRDPEVEGRFSIGTNSPVSLAVAMPGNLYYRTNFYLNGTDVNLLLPGDSLQERHMLIHDDCFAFGGSRWGGDYLGPGSTEDAADGFAYWAYRFMQAGTSPRVQQGANPESAVAAMYNFMLVFSLWANKCDDYGHFPTYKLNRLSTAVPEFELLNDLAGGGPKNLGSFLSEITGPNGLLK